MATHRGAGEGTFMKRNGRYEARMRYTDPATGESKRLAVSAKTRDECRRKLSEARKRVTAGQPAKDSTQTFGAWVRQWREQSLPASDRKPSTQALYGTIAKKHLEQGTIADVGLDRLRPTHIEALIGALKKGGMADTTVRNIYLVARAALDVAVRDGLVAENVCGKVKRPGAAKREARYLSVEDTVQLLGHMDGLRYGLAVRLAAATGLRRGEVCALRWEDLDLDGGWLTVTGTISRLNGVLVRGLPKSERSRRRVPLPPPLTAALRAHRRTQAAERLQAGNMWVDRDAVFCPETGGWLDGNCLLRTVRIAAKRVGLDGVSVHTLRHTAATAWLEQGAHIKTVSDLLGHSSIAVTGDIYGHGSDDRAQQAVAGLAGALGV